METKCSLMSKRPKVCQYPACSKPGLMSTRKYKYTIPPSSAVATYRTTTALAKDAAGTVRNRPKNEPGRAAADAQLAKAWCVIAPSSATATKPCTMSSVVTINRVPNQCRHVLLEQFHRRKWLG